MANSSPSNGGRGGLTGLIAVCVVMSVQLIEVSAQLSGPSIESSPTGSVTINLPDSTNDVMVARQGVPASRVVLEDEFVQTVAELNATIQILREQIRQLQETRTPTTPPTMIPSTPPTVSPTAPPTTSPTSTPSVSPTAAPTCLYGPNGEGTGCATWHDVTVYDIKDIASAKSDISVDTNPFSISAVANSRGCGVDGFGSSMGFYIAGAWTKIRYTTTFTGRASCYSLFGNNRFNTHEHTDPLDRQVAADSRTSLPYLSQLGAEGGGLYEFNASAGDTIQRTNFPCPGSSWTCSYACTNAPHPLYNRNSGLVQATVTLRRRYNTFANGVRQYADEAGPSVGMSCIGGAQWNISNVQVLQ